MIVSSFLLNASIKAAKILQVNTESDIKGNKERMTEEFPHLQ